MLHEFLNNFLHNLFKPLLLFFYAGFAIPLLKVKFEFPKVLYQGLTIYLLLSIGWHGGEELAGLEPAMYGQAAGFMVLGFITNTIVGCAAYFALRKLTQLRRVDAATVAGYYGSDSAGTFVTCLGVLSAANIAFAPYMPVMLAIMEIPGCLVALFIVSRLRRNGLDAQGNMPGEVGYGAVAKAPRRLARTAEDADEVDYEVDEASFEEEELVGAAAGGNGRFRYASVASHAAAVVVRGRNHGHTRHDHAGRNNGDLGSASPASNDEERKKALAAEDEIALQKVEGEVEKSLPKASGAFNAKLLHEVLLNPGIYLLFAGIVIGFVSRLQGAKVIIANDHVFVELFQGMLCLFLLEMGITASKKLKDLKAGGWRFALFALLAPNVFAAFGMLMARGYSLATGMPLEIGTYVLFAVLCGAASYIALPAVQRMAIPEASPTLPLAASLGITFSYNVTIGIPVYILLANLIAGAPPAVSP
ncbi:MAG: sodium-dependent bicarbonate transport family permease [Pirellulales bacterium]